MKTLYAFICAFICMSTHRNQKMIHVNSGDHLVTCKTCDSKKSEYVRTVKNYILTFFYFNRNLFTALFMFPITMFAIAHLLLTGREGSFEHPPEHRNKSLIFQ